MVKHIESAAHAALLEELKQARELGVTRQAIQKMVAAGQDGPRR